MAMTTCAECTKPMSDTATACPSCGAPAAVALKTAEPKGSAFRGIVWIIIGVVVLIGVIGSQFGGSSSPSPPGPTQAERVATAKQALKENRAAILADARAKMSAGNYAGAAQTLYRFRSTNDAEVEALYAEANEKSLLGQLAKLPKDDLEGQLKVYASLAGAFPQRPEYLEKKRALDERIAAERDARIKAAVAALKRNHDAVENITWYRDKASPNYNNTKAFYLYFGEKAGSRWLRLRVQYAADDWLFVNMVIVVADDQKFMIVQPGWERDHDSSIWEWLDYGAGAAEVEMARAVAKAKSVTIRFEGRQYRNDWTLPRAHREALTRVLQAYEALGGNAT